MTAQDLTQGRPGASTPDRLTTRSSNSSWPSNTVATRPGRPPAVNPPAVNPPVTARAGASRGIWGRVVAEVGVMTATLVVDLSNKSAVVTRDGRTELMWSGVTRRPAEVKAHAAGWRRCGDWVLTCPPDGFWCPVQPCTVNGGAS